MRDATSLFKSTNSNTNVTHLLRILVEGHKYVASCQRWSLLTKGEGQGLYSMRWMPSIKCVRVDLEFVL